MVVDGVAEVSAVLTFILGGAVDVVMVDDNVMDEVTADAAVDDVAFVDFVVDEMVFVDVVEVVTCVVVVVLTFDHIKHFLIFLFYFILRYCIKGTRIRAIKNS